MLLLHAPVIFAFYSDISPSRFYKAAFPLYWTQKEALTPYQYGQRSASFSK